MSTLLERSGLKWLVMFLSFTLVLAPFVSVVNGETSTSGSEDQIGSYVDINKSGKIKDGTSTKNPRIKIGTKSKSYVRHSQTVNPTKTEDLFRIDVNVKTNEVREDVVTSVPKPLDVVIIMDVSGSMDGAMNGSTTKSRWEIARDSMVSFIGDFLGGANAVSGSRVSIGTFSGQIGSPDVSYDDHNIKLCSWTSSTSAAISSIQGLNDTSAAVLPGQGSGTNLEAGFVAADSLLNQAKSSNNDKIVIYASDGQATYHYDSTGLTIGGGSTAHTNAAINKLKDLKSKHEGLKVFTLGIGSSLTDDPVLQYELGKDGGVDKFFSAITAADIGKAFDEINDSITHSVKLWTVNSPISKWVKFKGFDSLNGGNTSADGTAKFKDNKVTWNLENINAKKDGAEYKYKLSYYVQLDKTTKGFTSGVYYPTNGKTTIKYALENDKVVKSKTLSNFKIPTVKGEANQVTSQQVTGGEGNDYEPQTSDDETKGHDPTKAVPFLLMMLAAALTGIVIIKKRMIAEAE